MAWVGSGVSTRPRRVSPVGAETVTVFCCMSHVACQEHGYELDPGFIAQVRVERRLAVAWAF